MEKYKSEYREPAAPPPPPTSALYTPNTDTAPAHAEENGYQQPYRLFRSRGMFRMAFVIFSA